MGKEAAMVYFGLRERGHCRVWWIDGDERQELPLRLDLVEHSPTGFCWSYGGSGPAQLALALLAHALADDEAALRLYQEYKWRVVALLPAEGWSLPVEEVRAVAEALTREMTTGAAAPAVDAEPDAPLSAQLEEQWQRVGVCPLCGDGSRLSKEERNAVFE